MRLTNYYMVLIFFFYFVFFKKRDVNGYKYVRSFWYVTSVIYNQIQQSDQRTDDLRGSNGMSLISYNFLLLINWPLFGCVQTPDETFFWFSNYKFRKVIKSLTWSINWIPRCTSLVQNKISLAYNQSGTIFLNGLSLYVVKLRVTVRQSYMIWPMTVIVDNKNTVQSLLVYVKIKETYSSRKRDDLFIN